MYRKLENTVPISNITRMYYEEGMTMKDIAATLGVCSATVSRYIGNHRKPKEEPVMKPTEPSAPKKTFGDRIEEYLASHKVVEVVRQPEPEAPPSTLSLVSNILTYKGGLCQYTVNTSDGQVELAGDTLYGVLSKGDLDTIIAELNEIRRTLSA